MEIAGGLEVNLPLGLLKQQPLNGLNGGRPKIQKLDRRLHRVGDGREENQAEAFLTGQWRNLEFGGENGGKRSLAASQDLVEIIWRTRESFDPVTRPTFHQPRRPAFSHFGARCVNEIIDLVAFLA